MRVNQGFPFFAAAKCSKAITVTVAQVDIYYWTGFTEYTEDN